MNERLERVISHPATVPAVVGAISFGAGILAGVLLEKRQKGEVVHLSVVEDSPQMEFDFDNGYIYDSNGVPVVDDIQEDLEDGSTEEVEDEPQELVMKSVFGDSGDEWDLEAETKNRSENAPYIIHKDEFFMDEKGYVQLTLTYYNQDRILCDDDDVPIYNHEVVTGPLRFGHGSDDQNVVYIRNDKRRAEYEVINFDGLYSLEVLGLEIENNQRVKDTKHSKNRKFREE